VISGGAFSGMNYLGGEYIGNELHIPHHYKIVNEFLSYSWAKAVSKAKGSFSD